MMNYIRNANHLSHVLKQTAKRVAVANDRKVERAPGHPPMRMFVSVDGRLTVPVLSPKARHLHCHSKARSYGLGNQRAE